MQCLAQRPVAGSHGRAWRSYTSTSRSRTVKVQAIFGWGKKEQETDEEAEWKRMEKEDQYRVQQEMLQKRRSGAAIREANQRRQKVQEELSARKGVRQAERDSLARGVIPETFKNWKPYSEEAEKNSGSGIVVPLLPFGNRKYDEGERFDLRSPYADEGWVDPEETDMWGGFKKISQKILDFGQVKYTKPGEKPILWASEYARQQREKNQKDQK